jgi:hypothetical protein
MKSRARIIIGLCSHPLDLCAITSELFLITVIVAVLVLLGTIPTLFIALTEQPYQVVPINFLLIHDNDNNDHPQGPAVDSSVFSYEGVYRVNSMTVDTDMSPPVCCTRV